MKRILIVGSLVWMFFTTYSQSVPVMDFSEFQNYLNKNNDTTYVLNFWATWCSPCVEELPYFEKINREFRNRKFKMILVSLDFKRHLQSRLLPFIEENHLEAEVILLSDPDANAWINKIDSSWTGAIPATIIYNKDFRHFREGSFTYDELHQLLQPLVEQ